MNFALDQYFTPPALAEKVASVISPFSPTRIVDSNCGRGELLAACQITHPRSTFYGIDIDATVIDRLAGERPEWQLRHGDALTREAWTALGIGSFCAAILNPPFSLQGKKLLTVGCGGVELQASPALAHVLSAIELGNPKVIAAILPESCAGSELDRCARRFIERSYEVSILERVGPSAFVGASANSFIVRMIRSSQESPAVVSSVGIGVSCPVEVVRGGVPVFQRIQHKSGLPFIHSVNLRDLDLDMVNKLERVQAINRGVIQGHFVLFPRVGLPSRGGLKAVHFEDPVQLSDCVMGVRCRDRIHAEGVSEALEARFVEFSDLYRGTGARYVTIASVKAWLATNSSAFVAGS